MKSKLKSFLQHLENNEAILLMYLSGELPEQDLQEVEQMLASDPTLCAELEIVRQTQELAFDSLQSLDGLTRPPVPPIVAMSQVSRLMHDWAERRRRPAEVAPPASVMPWRRISFAAAAVLLVGCYIWAVYNSDTISGKHVRSSVAISSSDPEELSEVPAAPAPKQLTQQEKVALLSNSLEDSATSDASDLHVVEVAAVTSPDLENSTSDHNTEGDQ